MSSPQGTTTADLQAVAEALRAHDRFVVATHENPDGDALGSLLSTTLALRQLGKDVEMYLYGDAPLPREYAFMELEGLRRRLPDDASERVLVAVDCAKADRLGPDELVLEVPASVADIDHHHDNTRFGDVNLIVPDASSTGEVLRDVFRELGVELTPELAEPLYIALVTDTGRFQYTNTTPKALRLAAELVEAGADVHRVFQGVYESIEFAKLKLLARALERAAIYEGGRVVVSYLLRTDFAEVGAAEPYSEGIIDYLRAVEGAHMAVLIREPPREEGPSRRVSLRSSIDELDVSAIARKSGGGGHRQAAGFSSEDSIEAITEFVRREFSAAAAADASARA
jgi:bifunctional oligoribonuclease and PAP phosphatase NrnA